MKIRRAESVRAARLSVNRADDAMRDYAGRIAGRITHRIIHLLFIPSRRPCLDNLTAT
ncbi:hypothetical protein [Burkholderia gladioli]|uniref:hypothetical protein n=1 Tax=Burkholderia gladioli TaxID=28095 RepID=UPI0013DE65CD|nr:hypothetical protein [Burkholderia gladioli]